MDQKFETYKRALEKLWNNLLLKKYPFVERFEVFYIKMVELYEGEGEFLRVETNVIIKEKLFEKCGDALDAENPNEYYLNRCINDDLRGGLLSSMVITGNYILTTGLTFYIDVYGTKWYSDGELSDDEGNILNE